MPIDPRRILFEDDSLLAVHKLPQELSVRGKGEVQRLPLLDFLKKDYPGLRPLNRLDFETSGVLVFAKTKEVLARVLDSKFSGWKKTYRTIVHGKIPVDDGAIRTPLPSRIDRSSLPSETQYRVLERFSDCTFVEIILTHGRHHQIRRHFASFHHALVLDPLYGDQELNVRFTKRYGFRRFFLHALALDFPHPLTGETLHIESPLPPIFAQAFERIRRGGIRTE